MPKIWLTSKPLFFFFILIRLDLDTVQSSYIRIHNFLVREQLLCNEMEEGGGVLSSKLVSFVSGHKQYPRRSKNVMFYQVFISDSPTMLSKRVSSTGIKRWHNKILAAAFSMAVLQEWSTQLTLSADVNE